MSPRLLLLAVFLGGAPAFASRHWSSSEPDSRTIDGNKKNGLRQLQPKRRQKSPPKQPLEFIHITKTGGTAVELAGAASGFKWGVCHYGIVENGEVGGCNAPDWRGGKMSSSSPAYEGALEPWHTPPHWLEPNPMEGSNTFVIVRDPYERLVSEYYCFSGAGYQGRNIDNTQTFNQWLSDKLVYVDMRIRGKRLWDNHGHLIPQAMYVFDNNDNQIVTHVLKYENLKADFDDLMKHYSIHAQLPPMDKSKEHEKFHLNGAPRITVSDISRQNIIKINDLYHDDFTKFSYAMIEPSVFE